MPQLDLVTFFSQFFWLCVFYIGFYYILYKYFLPQYSRCILFRDKYSIESQQGASAGMEEKENIEESLSMYTTNAVSSSKNFFENSKDSTGNWHKSSLKDINERNWKAANVLYIKTFGAKQVSKNISRDCISYMVGKYLYSAGLSKTSIKYCQNMENIPSSMYTKDAKIAAPQEIEKTEPSISSKAPLKKGKNSSPNPRLGVRKSTQTRK
jgi:hypothetical protein